LPLQDVATTSKAQEKYRIELFATVCESVGSTLEEEGFASDSNHVTFKREFVDGSLEVPMDELIAFAATLDDNMLFCPLNVKFVGEDGIDAGGLTADFFRSFYTGMLKDFWMEEGGTTVLPRNDVEPQRFFQYGRLVLKCLYEKRPVAIAPTLATSFYKYLAHIDPDINDFGQFASPDHVQSMQHVTTASKNDLDLMGLNFEGHPVYGNQPVTELNRHVYINSRIQHCLVLSRKEQLDAFCSGLFSNVTITRILSSMTWIELRVLFGGTEASRLTAAALLAVTSIVGFPEGSTTPEYFRGYLLSLSSSQLAAWVVWVTGSPQLPLDCRPNFIKIECCPRGDIDRLPISHVCFHLVELPDYADEAKLRMKLTQVLEEGGNVFAMA